MNTRNAYNSHVLYSSMLSVGPHKIETKSIEDVDYSSLLGGETADILYTDPPWGDRMMSFFGTMREKQTDQSGDNISYEAMLRTLRDIIDDHVEGIVVVTVSMDDDTVQTILSPVLHNADTQITQYRGGGELRKCKTLLAGTAPEYSFSGDISRTQGMTMATETIHHAKDAADGNLVLDPMCGQGNAAVAAIKNGCRFAGNEFNIARVNDAVDRIKTAQQKHEVEA